MVKFCKIWSFNNSLSPGTGRVPAVEWHWIRKPLIIKTADGKSANIEGLLRPCILNFKPNIRVAFWVGTSFSRFPKFDFNILFCNFWKVRKRTNSEFSVNSECLETPVSELFPKFRKFRLTQGLRAPCTSISFLSVKTR